jgi:hypothetical protein
MATQAPHIFDLNDDPDDLDDALTHTHGAQMACKATQAMAAPFDKLIAELDGLRPARRGLQRTISALDKQRKPVDDDLNGILDIVRGTLEPRIKDTKDHEPEPWAVQAFDDCFGDTKPADARKHTLGPQVEIQRFWETKLAKAPVPELVQAGKDNTPIIARADALVGDIAVAEAALDQFLLGPWADFVARCNAAFQLAFGQLGDLAQAPPAGVKIPPGFLDRFFLREPAPRPMSVTELKKAIERTKARLTKLEAMLAEKQDKQKNEKRTKLLKEAADAQGQVEAAKQQSDDAANRLAALQAELAKLTPPEPPPDKPKG